MEKYIILRAKSPEALVEIVNAAIAKGYEVNGAPISGTFNWYQSMLTPSQVSRPGPTEHKTGRK